MLGVVPGIRVAARDGARLREELGEALEVKDGPTAHSIPQRRAGAGYCRPWNARAVWMSWPVRAEELGRDVLLVAVGAFAPMALKVEERLRAHRHRGHGRRSALGAAGARGAGTAMARAAQAGRSAARTTGRPAASAQRSSAALRAADDRRAVPRRGCAAAVPGARVPRRGARRGGTRPSSDIASGQVTGWVAALGAARRGRRGAYGLAERMGSTVVSPPPATAPRPAPGRPVLAAIAGRRCR